MPSLSDGRRLLLCVYIALFCVKLTVPPLSCLRWPLLFQTCTYVRVLWCNVSVHLVFVSRRGYFGIWHKTQRSVSLTPPPGCCMLEVLQPALASPVSNVLWRVFSSSCWLCRAILHAVETGPSTWCDVSIRESNLPQNRSAVNSICPPLLPSGSYRLRAQLLNLIFTKHAKSPNAWAHRRWCWRNNGNYGTKVDTAEDHAEGLRQQGNAWQPLGVGEELRVSSAGSLVSRKADGSGRQAV